MKKIIALVLATVMMTGMLTGCGLNELGYLDMVAKANKIQIGSATSETEVKLNVKAIKNMIWELAAGDITLEELEAIKLNGSKIKIWTEMKYDVKDKSTKNALYDLNISVAWENNPKMELLTLKMIDNKVYVGRSSLENMGKLLNQMINLSEASNNMYPLLTDALTKEFTNENYIILADLAAIENDDNALIENADITKLTEISENYIKTIASGFKNTIVKKIANGYEIEMNAQKALDLTKSFTKYLSENKEMIFAETVKMIKEISTLAQPTIDVEKELSEDAIKPLENVFFNIVDATNEELNAENETTKMLNELVANMADTNIKYSISNEENLFNEIMDAKLDYKKETLMEIKSKTAMRELSKVNIDRPVGTVIPLEEYATRANDVYNTVNPIAQMEIPWMSEKVQGLTEVSYERKYNTQTNLTNYFLKDNTLYLPLRKTCETFSENVNWDNDLRKAYILRGEEKIYVDGLLVESQTYVKVRDFEKLNYKVNYTGKDGANKVIIAK